MSYVRPRSPRCKITSAESDSDFVSFADTAAGGKRDYTLEFTAVQDPADVTSLWYVMWDQTGTDVEVEVLPYGGAVVSATNPKFTGTVTVTEPDGDILGGDADPSTSARFTIDLAWKFSPSPPGSSPRSHGRQRIRLRQWGCARRRSLADAACTLQGRGGRR